MRHVTVTSITAITITIIVSSLVFAQIQPKYSPPPVAVPTPTSPYSLPGLGKLLSNQGVQIWVLQQQVKTLQSQLATAQSAINAQQQAIAKLQGQLTSFQQTYAKHTHQYLDASTGMSIDTVPQMYCTHTGSGGSCWSTGTLTIMLYAGHNASMVSTSPPR